MYLQIKRASNNQMNSENINVTMCLDTTQKIILSNKTISILVKKDIILML